MNVRPDQQMPRPATALQRFPGWLVVKRLAQSRAVVSAAAIVVVCVVWEAFVDLLGVKEYVLPAPSAVLASLISRRSLLLSNSGITIVEILSGYLLAIAVAVPIAVGVSSSRLMQHAFYPVLVISQIVPKIAIAPLFVIWFGFTFLPKLLLTFLLCFFPIVVDGITGFRSLDAEVEEFGRSTGAGAIRMFVKIRLPSALPSLMSGLKIAATQATVGAIVAEFVASSQGLGYVLLEANGNLDTSLVFATVVILSVIGLALYFAVEVAERLLIPWHVSMRTGGQGEFEGVATAV